MEATVNKQPLKGIPTGEGLTFEKVWAMFQETDRQMKEIKQSIKETDKIVKENARQMGYLNNRFGEMAEHLVAPGIHERFFELGYNFSAIRPGGYEVCNDKKEVIAEVDILLENGDYIMAVEVKAKPHIKDIKHHIKRLKILRKDRDKHRDTRKIQGAIAGAIFGSKEKQAAIDAGFFVLEQTGDTVKIDIPKGFIPGEW
jgi:uncharacterized coiled-coil protein SlyX